MPDYDYQPATSETAADHDEEAERAELAAIIEQQRRREMIDAHNARMQP